MFLDENQLLFEEETGCRTCMYRKHSSIMTFCLPTKWLLEKKRKNNVAWI
jgi:hypothetical protein